MKNESGSVSGKEIKLSVDTVKDLWSRTYNKEGKPDWSHIFPYYHEDIIFQDSIQRIEGIKSFKEMCKRLTKRCQKLEMDIYSIAQNGNDIFMQWKMTMVFRRSPDTPLYGCTKLTLNEEGKITMQRDYYDLWGDIFRKIKGIRTLYKLFMEKLFG